MFISKVAELVIVEAINECSINGCRPRPRPRPRLVPDWSSWVIFSTCSFGWRLCILCSWTSKLPWSSFMLKALKSLDSLIEHTTKLNFAVRDHSILLIIVLESTFSLFDFILLTILRVRWGTYLLCPHLSCLKARTRGVVLEAEHVLLSLSLDTSSPWIARFPMMYFCLIWFPKFLDQWLGIGNFSLPLDPLDWP